jgi:hypothetical protein
LRSNTRNSTVGGKNALLSKDRGRSSLLLEVLLDAGLLWRAKLPPFGFGALNNCRPHEATEQVHHIGSVLGQRTRRDDYQQGACD